MDPELIARLRDWMRHSGVEAWLDSGLDPHGSEYPLRHWRTRQALSGFTGSAGVIALLTEGGLLCTDSRYWLQASAQLPPAWALVRATGSLDRALQDHWEVIGPPAALALNPWQWPWERWQVWARWAESRGVRILPAAGVVERSWANRPEPPAGLIRDFEHDFAVDGRTLKLDRVRAALRAHRAEAALLGALDQVAWVLNLRGNDIDFNPLFESYLYVDRERAVLYCHPDGLEEGLRETLARDRVQVRPVAAVEEALADPGVRLLVDPQHTPAALVLGRAERLVCPVPSPVALMKAVKSPSERDGFRRAMVADGRALVRFLCWWEDQRGDLTEGRIADALWAFRVQEGAWTPSFATIAAWGPNGAVVHYDPGPEGAAVGSEGLLLVDSGAHYPWGTTDVTRVLCRGRVRPEWRRDYTRVLQALIRASTTPFPRGSRGYQVDALARGELWRHRLQYGHGTGHGVGHVLSVHEGPQRLGPDPNPQELLPGMVVSVEPGLYRAGAWGVRLENLAVVTEAGTDAFGDWLQLDTLTLAPFEPELVDQELLLPAERAWLNAYHRQVERALAPGLDVATAGWLRRRTASWERLCG